ncbi:MAG: DUF1254 domain-containing protein [Pararobbsia sp.]
MREGLRVFGAKKPTQVVVWENLMDAQTVLLTANTETVYAISHLDLKTDGPTVIEAPPHMLGFVQDGLQRYVADIGPLGAGQGQRREIPDSAARVQRQCPEGILRRQIAHVLRPVCRPKFSGRWQDRSGSRPDEADQNLPVGSSLFATSNGVHERFPAKHRHAVS